MTSKPAYITRSVVVGAPISFRWTGRLEHIGPIEGTALHESIYEISLCGAVALTAALEEWAAWRFDSMVDRDRYFAHADASRAWTIDKLYLRPIDDDETKEPPAKAAMAMIAQLVADSTTNTFARLPSELPDGAVHVAFLVRHVMPKESRKAFDAWMKWALGRLAVLSPRPSGPIPEFEDYDDPTEFYAAQRPFFGLPLPPEALDPDAKFELAQRELLVDSFLQKLDWQNNPFLRSPDDMKQLGFGGTPYRLG